MLRTMDPARDNLADNEEIQVGIVDQLSHKRTKHTIRLGTVPVLHVAPAQDREVDRQVQPEARLVCCHEI